MKPSVLRAFMRRHGNAGVVVVGIYLGLHHLWHRHRTATVIIVCSLLPVAAFFCSRLGLISHPKAVIEVPTRFPAQSEVVRPVKPPVAPHGKPLFSRAKRLFGANGAWSWGGWDHAEYRWLSDSQILFAEQYLSNPGNRIQSSHLYRYDVRTGRKTQLKRLERLIHCFYHSQMETSPDGKWLLWHGGTSDRQTLDAATLDGRHHRQWPGEFWGSRLRWTPDSRNWIEFKHDGAEPPSFSAIRHNAYNLSENRSYSMEEGSFEIYPGDYAVADHIILLDPTDPRDTTRTLKVTVSSLPPHVRLEHTTQIAVPNNLPNPNIVNVCLSPDARRVAFIVGYEDTPTCFNMDVNTPEGNTAPATSAYHPSWVFTQKESNTKLRAYCILACRIDGSEMHEVGTWQEQVNPNVVLDLENLRWLPSGKRLSFVCNDWLYTVPAD